jgi:starvation-inducible DNA-binding protein
VHRVILPSPGEVVGLQPGDRLARVVLHLLDELHHL